MQTLYFLGILNGTHRRKSEKPTGFHSHWHSVVKLLDGLVVDGDGHLCVGVKDELYIVAGPVLPRRLISRQLQVIATPGQTDKRRVPWS